MEIDDSDADAAKSFSANHAPRSARLGFINDALTKLVVELDKATRAIKDASQESKTGSAQIRDNLASAGNSIHNNLAKLGESINRATELEKESSKKLAKSVNTLTPCLVLIR